MCNAHGFLRSEAELVRCRLLEERCRKRKGRLALLQARSDFPYRKISLSDACRNGLSLLLIGYLRLVTLQAHKPCPERLLLRCGEISRNRPVLLYLEAGDLCLTLADQPQCDGLYPAGRKSAQHHIPQKGADLVAHNFIKPLTGLLGAHKAVVDLPWSLDGRNDRIFGDFIKKHPGYRFVCYTDFL